MPAPYINAGIKFRNRENFRYGVPAYTGLFRALEETDVRIWLLFPSSVLSVWVLLTNKDFWSENMHVYFIFSALMEDAQPSHVLSVALQVIIGQKILYYTVLNVLKDGNNTRSWIKDALLCSDPNPIFKSRSHGYIKKDVRRRERTILVTLLLLAVFIKWVTALRCSVKVCRD
jgi:hypothetical protein